MRHHAPKHQLPGQTLGVSWRWQLAQKVAAGRKHLSGDALTGEVARFLRARKETASPATDTAAAIPQAVALADDAAATEKLQILVLARCSAEEIGAKLGITSEVVKTWEEIFFDVRSGLESVSWVLDQVVGPALKDGSRRRAAKLKLAYVGGRLAAESLLDMPADGKPISADRAFALSHRLQIKAILAGDMPIETSDQAIAYQKIFAEVRSLDLRLRLERARLDERCRENLRRHEREKIRLQVRLARLEAKSSAKQDEARTPCPSESPQVGEGASEPSPEAAELARLTWRTSKRSKAHPVTTAPQGPFVLPGAPVMAAGY